ncbi:RING finger protein 44 [Nematostella vectensis]|uniref:RING finger protein 44 n=1 Tax=Nematostella vectensis TaxID=45351 RepID=UPI00138FA8DF|nr:RING finger protein 44 [Nematostella vectensis]XP_032222697.1 RING finger protein 44 [Nematostella vectensis]
MASTASASTSSLEHPGPSSCNTYAKNEIKHGYHGPHVIDLTSEAATPPLSHQPLRHMPHHLFHSSAFHRVNGQPYDSHGPTSANRGCPYLQNQSTREHRHHPHHRQIHHVPNPSYCPSMSSTVPLQHPPVNATPVIIDPDQLPSHVRAVPITSLPNRLIVNSVPMATPTYVQPPSNEADLPLDPTGNHRHYHHHYHHHHHHHHHFVQPPYQVPPPPTPQPYHPHPYPSSGPMHHRHYRRWHNSNGAHQEWAQPVDHHAVPIHAHTGVQTYPDLLYHLLSVMSMQPAPPHATPQAAWEESYQQENYETLLNLAEQIGEAKPKGLTRAEIDQLPTYRVTAESKKQNDDARCVVCLVDFEEKQLVRTLPCLHEYHTRCIDKWLKSNRTCPICRTEIKVSGN